METGKSRCTVWTETTKITSQELPVHCIPPNQCSLPFQTQMAISVWCWEITCARHVWVAPWNKGSGLIWEKSGWGCSNQATNHVVSKPQCCEGAVYKITSSPSHCYYIPNYTVGGQTTSSIKLKSLTQSLSHPHPSRTQPLSAVLCVAAEPQRSSLALLSLAAPCRGTAALSPTSGSFLAPIGLFLQHFVPGEWCWPRCGSVWLPWVLGFTGGWQGPSPGQEVSLFLRLCLVVVSCRWELHCQEPPTPRLAKQRLAKPRGAQHCPGSGTGQHCLGTCRVAALGEGTPFRWLNSGAIQSSACRAPCAGMAHPRLDLQLVPLPAPSCTQPCSHAPACLGGCPSTRPFETLPWITGISGKAWMFIQPGAHGCLAEHWLYVQGCQWHRRRAEQLRGSRQQQGSQGEERVPWKRHFPWCFAPAAPCR